MNGISDEGNVSQENEVGMLRIPQALALNLMVSHPSQTKHSGREIMKLRQPRERYRCLSLPIVRPLVSGLWWQQSA